MDYGTLVRGGHPIAIRNKALKLLEALIRSPGRVLKCPLMAQSGHDLVRRTCLLSRLTRTSTIAGRMAVGCAVELAMHRAAA